jgi:hypothetical protein
MKKTKSKKQIDQNQIQKVNEVPSFYFMSVCVYIAYNVWRKHSLCVIMLPEGVKSEWYDSRLYTHKFFEVDLTQKV